MKTSNYFFVALVFVFSLTVAGCIGDEGPMGTQGEQGIAGLDGAVFYSGTITPAANIGKDGDMYLDKVAAMLYGPKLSGSWGTGVSLKGAAGAPGATGAQGPQGAQGATGAQGPTGNAGSKILSGTGSPVLTVGVAGDYYLDKNTGLLYGPKTSTTWGTPTNLKGAQGIQGLPGEDGAMFYSGNGAPAATVGKDGDMYLDKTNVLLYGPKTSGSWGTGLSLKGATGATGPQGPAGIPGSKILSGNGSPDLTVGVSGDYYLDKTTGLLYGPKTSTTWGTPTNLKGAQGIQGLPGEDGSMFYSGNGVPATTLGKVGDMYLDKTNILLYGPKTSTSWGTALSLKGTPGAVGPQGPAGIPGSKILSGNGSPDLTVGVTGDYYLDKTTGLLYGPKTTASWGIPTNLKGAQGIQGLPGKDGSIFYSGNGAPAATVGKDGDMYLDKTNVLLYGPKTSGSWGSGLSLKGNTGAQGPAGTAGNKILSGFETPLLSLGDIGDFYLDLQNAWLYGPKTASGWGNPVNLKGPKGDKGDPGTANVIYSDWISPYFASASASVSASFYYIKVPEFILNPSLINNASIVVYAKELDADGKTVLGVFQLNFTSPYWGSVIQYYIDTNSDIIINASPDTKMGLNNSHQFRYVIIPGGVPATTRSAIDYSNYNAVKEAFGLKD